MLNAADLKDAHERIDQLTNYLRERSCAKGTIDQYRHCSRTLRRGCIHVV
jgi:hypothetical protein